MKVRLYYPPPTSMSLPTLATPMLVSALKKHGYSDTAQRDLNIEALSHFLSKERLSVSLERILTRLSSVPDGEEKVLLTRIASQKHLALDAISHSKKALKLLCAGKPRFPTESIFHRISGQPDDLQGFELHGEDRSRVQKLERYWERYKLDRNNWAFRILMTGMRMVAAEYFPAKVAGYFGLDLGISPRSSQEIIRFLQSVERHPYLDFYSERLLPGLLKDKPDLVGISITYWDQVVPGLLLARFLRQKTDAHVCVGGALMSEWEEGLSLNAELAGLADSFIIGEGEDSIVALARAIDQKGSWEDIPNRIWEEDGKVRKAPRKCLGDFGALPPPDFSGFDFSTYHPSGNRPVPLVYQVSRGCYWKRCAFCYSRKVYADNYVISDVKKIVNDLEHLTSKYHVQEVKFTDDSVTPGMLLRISKEILARGLDIHWYVNSRFEKGWTPEAARIIAKAGCLQVAFGLESGVQRVLDLMDKGTRIEEADRIIGVLTDAGIAVHMFAFAGFPTETKQELEQTLAFVGKWGNVPGKAKVSTSLGPFVLHKDSPMFQSPSKYGLTKVFQKDPHQDLSPEYDYEAEGGLSQADCSQLFSDTAALPVYIQVPFENDFWGVSLGQ